MSHLLRYLEAHRLLGPDPLGLALRRAHIYGGSLDTVLLELGLVQVRDLDAWLSAALGLPSAPAHLLQPGPIRPWDEVPASLLAVGWVLPLAREGHRTLVAVHPDLPEEQRACLFEEIPDVVAFVTAECCLSPLAAEQTGTLVPQRLAVLAARYLAALATDRAPGVALPSRGPAVETQPYAPPAEPTADRQELIRLLAGPRVELERATLRDQITASLARGAAVFSNRVALFSVHQQGLVALPLRHGALSHLDGVTVPLAPGGTLERAVDGIAALSRLRDLDLRLAVGQETAIPCVFLPIIVRQRPVLVLYLDKNGADFDTVELELLDELAHLAAHALENLLRNRSRAHEATASFESATLPPAPIAPARTSDVSMSAQTLTGSAFEHPVYASAEPATSTTLSFGATDPVPQGVDEPTTTIPSLERYLASTTPDEPGRTDPSSSRPSGPAYPRELETEAFVLGNEFDETDALRSPSFSPLELESLAAGYTVPPPPPLSEDEGEAQRPPTLTGLPLAAPSGPDVPPWASAPTSALQSSEPVRRSTSPGFAPVGAPAAPARLTVLLEHEDREALDRANQEELEHAVDLVIAGHGDPTPLAAYGAPGLAHLVLRRFPGPLDVLRRDLAALPRPSAHGPLIRAAIAVGPVAVPYLIEALEHPNPDVRFYAAFVFQELRDPSCAHALSKLAFDPNGDVRVIAMRVLETYGRTEGFHDAIRDVREGLRSPNRTRQLQAARAAGTLRDVHAVSPLVELLSSPDRFIQEAALESLCSITGQQHGLKPHRWRAWYAEHEHRHRLEWIIDSLRHRDAAVRRWASDELSRVSGHRVTHVPPGEERQREALVDAWQSWWDNEGRARHEASSRRAHGEKR